MNNQLIVYYDGSCTPVNPGGKGGYGYVIYDGVKKIQEHSGLIPASPEMTNNVSEYAALVSAMEWLISNNFSHRDIQFFGDSKLTVMQMNGRWRAKKGAYLNYYRRGSNLLPKFTNIKFDWIPREQNAYADILSKALV